MPYTLVYSRSISSDAVVRVLDVPIPDKSIMIEVLSLISPYRRLFGYAYALRSDGITDYERSGGYILPFGKNRINFPAATAPYFLELFPRRGVTSGIVSVYTGEPGPPPPPTGEWKVVSTPGIEFRLSQNPGRIEYRQPIGSSIIQSMAAGAVAGVEDYGYVTWKRSDGSYWYTETSNLLQEFPTDQAGYDAQRTKPTAVIF